MQYSNQWQQDRNGEVTRRRRRRGDETAYSSHPSEGPKGRPFRLACSGPGLRPINLLASRFPPLPPPNHFSPIPTDHRSSSPPRLLQIRGPRVEGGVPMERFRNLSLNPRASQTAGAPLSSSSFSSTSQTAATPVRFVSSPGGISRISPTWWSRCRRGRCPLRWAKSS